MKVGRIVVALMFAFVLAVLGLSAYIVAYVRLGEYSEWRESSVNGPIRQVTRHYPNKQWCPILFAPAAAAESRWLGCPVELTDREEPIVVYDVDGAGDPFPAIGTMP